MEALHIHMIPDKERLNRDTVVYPQVELVLD